MRALCALLTASPQEPFLMVGLGMAVPSAMIRLGEISAYRVWRYYTSYDGAIYLLSYVSDTRWFPGRRVEGGSPSLWASRAFTVSRRCLICGTIFATTLACLSRAV